MLYSQGQLVKYKKWMGKIKYIIEENESYVVTLYNYHGFAEIDRTCYQHELSEAYEQVSI